MNHDGDATKLHGIQACVFDAYGTLFDVHSAVGRYKDALGPKAQDLSALWRQKQLEYTWLRSLMGAYADFWTITGEALDVALARFEMADEALRANLMNAYRQLEAYDEVPGTLEALGARGQKLAILSNGSPDMLAAAVSHAGIAERFDAVLSVDELRVFKPDQRVYQLACDRLGVDAAAICFVSSNGWDVHGAAHFGFQTVWMNRFGQVDEALPGRFRAERTKLDQLLDLVSD